MRIHQDFVDLLREFAVSGVRYLVIGGYAVGFHDRPRTTKDLDLLLDPSDANIMRACSALRTFGAPAQVIVDLSRASDDEVVWMGQPPLRIGFLRKADGVDFAAAFLEKAQLRIDEVDIDVLGLEDLIAAKQAAGRPQDLVDLTRLERLRTP